MWRRSPWQHSAEQQSCHSVVYRPRLTRDATDDFAASQQPAADAARTADGFAASQQPAAARTAEIMDGRYSSQPCRHARVANLRACRVFARPLRLR